jgi:hypothetical protein
MNSLIAAPSLLVLFSWLPDWFWGLPLIVLTVVLHAVGLIVISERVDHIRKNIVERYGYPVVFVAIVGAAALWAVILHTMESVIWSAAYLYIGALPDFRDAILYSISAMTTYGHSSMLLEKRWLLLGALEALDGMLLFGLTTAFLFGIIQKTHELKNRRSH